MLQESHVDLDVSWTFPMKTDLRLLTGHFDTQS
jgi:hypothetical protein